MTVHTNPVNQQQRLGELIRLFSRLGVIGFGGPQAHIAMANDEAVGRRQWLTQEQFTDGLALCEMLPGPASTQMGIYIGYLRAGQIGALAAGLAFIAPAFLIVVALSWAYFRYQGVPQLAAIFFGVSPVMIAIILGFCWKLGKKALRNLGGGAIALAVFVLTLFQVNTLVLFVLAGLLGLGLYGPKRPSLPPPLGAVVPVVINTVATLPPDVLTLSGFWGTERIAAYGWPLLSFFLKTGTFIFGGGLVIIPLLELEVVGRLHWLTATEFLNGIAIGQLSPGPVVLTAAFVGYKVAGVLGALVASVGIFTPSFLFIMAGAPVLMRLRQNPWAKGFLNGVKPAVLGAIAAATIPLAQAAFHQTTLLLSLVTVMIGAAALVALIRYRVTTWQLVLAGAAIGLAVGFSPLWGQSTG
ncbi:chromate transporter [filamentous cyanobacterium CCP5]|nr:chromate transporter [filamentous cyanobacterium CCP5]